jgi:hypothetical protein
MERRTLPKMSQDPLTRESLLFVNAGSSNQLGTSARTTGGGGYLGNYYLRLDWSTVDRFRGVQGDYITSENNEPRSLTWEGAKPLHTTLTAPETNTFLATGQKQEMVHYLLEPNNAAWNSADQGGTYDMLRKWIQDPDIYEGDPYYSYYLEQGVPVGPSSSPQTVPPVFNRPGPSGSFVDHTFAYLKPSENLEERDEGGLEITIEPVYNFFLDSMPAYEQITNDIPEALLPNFYIFETELRNTGSQTYSPDYYKALSFYDRMDDWFVETAPGSYTENTSKSYYQAYVSSLQTIKNSTATYNAVRMQYNDYTKNVAVLHSDIDAINRTNRVQSTAYGDQITSGLSFLPFYNIVTVGPDAYRATDQGLVGAPAAASSFFAGLFDVPTFDAESFIDLLQMYIITFLEKGINTSAQFHAFNREDNPTQTLVTASLYFDLSRRDAGANSLPGVPFQYNGFQNYASFLEARITENDSQMDDFVVDSPATSENQYWERDNVMLLRDYSNIPGWEEDPAGDKVYNPPDASAVTDFYDKIQTGEITVPMRGFETVLTNQGAFSETILYKIDKRVVDSAGNILPDIVQTIYLSPKFLDGGPLQYIDSQVRYGVRYQYDIQQVRVVFGNQYYYDDLQLYFAGFAGYGRAVGNALGFYRAEMQNILVDSYVSNEIRPYYPDDEDTPFATSQYGYFGVAPSNHSEINLEQWNYMAEGSSYGDDTKLSRVNLIMKRGFGFDGNPDGGAITANYNAPNLGAALDPGNTVAGGLNQDVPSAFGPFGEAPPPGSPESGTPGAPEQTLPGVEQIQGFEQLQEETEQASGYNLDGLLGGIEQIAGANGLPPGVGDLLGGVLNNLGSMGPGTMGSSGPFQGNPGGQNLGGQNLGGSPPTQGLGLNIAGSLGAMNLGGNFGGNFGGGYSP